MHLHFLKDSLDTKIFNLYNFSNMFYFSTGNIINSVHIFRTEYTSKISDKQEKILFLSSIKTWREFLGSLYHIRQDYIPALPEFQDELNVESDFFKINNKTIVVGDKIFSDGLRVLLFSTDECLELLSRS